MLIENARLLINLGCLEIQLSRFGNAVLIVSVPEPDVDLCFLSQPAFFTVFSFPGPRKLLGCPLGGFFSVDVVSIGLATSAAAADRLPIIRIMKCQSHTFST